MAAAKITVSSLTRRFGDVVAVDDVDLQIADGEVVSLLGPSGCGKTTLLRLIAGFESPDAGEIRIDGSVVAGGGIWQAPCQRKVGLVFQDYALFPHLTVADNIGFGLPRRQRDERSTHLLERMGLEGLGGRHPHQLSGGQQQRVAVARALAPRPPRRAPRRAVEHHRRSTARRAAHRGHGRPACRGRHRCARHP